MRYEDLLELVVHTSYNIVDTIHVFMKIVHPFLNSLNL